MTTEAFVGWSALLAAAATVIGALTLGLFFAKGSRGERSTMFHIGLTGIQAPFFEEGPFTLDTIAIAFGISIITAA